MEPVQQLSKQLSALLQKDAAARDEALVQQVISAVLEIWQLKRQASPEEWVQFLNGHAVAWLQALFTRLDIPKSMDPEPIAELMRDVIRLFVDPANAESTEIAECLNVVLDPKNSFYKAFGAAATEETGAAEEEDLMWRWTVGFADWIDAVYVDPATKLRRWKKAQIVEENAYGKIRLSYENMTEYYDVWVARDSPDIAPPNTKSKEEQEWRFGLKQGDLVDAIDSLRVWFNATILDRKETGGYTVDGKKIPEVKVGFRIYRPDGEKADSRGNFMGWSSQYDEWLPVTSTRIQPLNSMAQGKNSWTSNSVDDSEDPEDENVYAVLRSERLNNTWLVDMINFFGNNNGFQVLLDRLMSDQPLPLGVLQPVCNVMANISLNLTRRVAQAFVDRMGEGMTKSVLTLREQDIRVLSKERLDTLLATMQTFVCRVRPKGAVNEQLTLLTLTMAICFYKSPFMERKVQGLKILLDTLKSTNRMANEFLNVPFMVNWLQQHNIVAVVFDGPPQLFEKTKELILFLAREKALTLDDVQVFWRAAEREKGTEHETHVYKVIAHVGYYLSVELLSYIVDRIEETPLEQMTEAMVTVLMKDLPQYCSRSVAPSERVVNLLWQLSSDDFRGEPKLRAKARTTLCEVYKIFYVKPLRWAGILRCFQLIKDRQHSHLAVTVLHAIIESHFQSSQTSTASTVTNVEIMNRREIIMKLQTEADLLNVLVNELCTYLTDRAATFTRLESETGAALSDRERDAYTPADTHVSHEAQVKARLDGIASVLNSAPLELDFDITRKLWQALVVQPSTRSERIAGFKFMMKACDANCFNPADNTVNRIFSELILARPELIWESADGFSCFEQYFRLVNTKENKLQRRQTGSSKDTQSVSYTVLVPPNELIGEAQIWDVILHAPSNDVAMAAIKLLNSINENPSAELVKSDVLGRTRESFIGRCMKTLDAIAGEEQKTDDVASKERSVVRSLDLIEQLLTQTELEQHGGVLRPSKATLVLRPHMTRVKAKKVTIVFDNNIQGSPLPTTFEGRFFANQTIWDVRREVARLNKLLPEHIRLVRNGKEVTDAQNHSVLAELHVARKEQWRCSKRSGPEMPPAELLDSKGFLLPRSREIFTELFFKFAPDGLMTPEGAAAFIDSCVHDNCQPTDNRVKNFFDKYDHDRDGCLTVVNFLQLYQDSTKSMLGVVWQNLHAHGYRNDLRKENEGWDQVDEEESSASVSLEDLKPTPRYILTSNRAYFDSLLNLFSKMDWASDATKARLWGLLMRLPTSPYVLREVQEMPDEDTTTGRVDWSKMFDVRNPFKLLYQLQVIYSILQPPDNRSGGERESVEFRSNWLRCFVYRGGFKQLFDAVRTHWAELLPKDRCAGAAAFGIETEVRFQCLALMLKCVKLYVLASLAIDTPELFVSVRLFRQGSAVSEPMVHDDGRTAALPAAAVPNVDGAETSDQGSEAASEGGDLKEPNLDEPATATDAIFGDEVAELQAVITDEIAASIINMIDFPLLQVIALDVTKQAGEITNLISFEVPDRHALNDTVEAALSMWVGCILSRPHLLTVLIYSHRSNDGTTGFAAYTSLQDRFLPAMLCRSKSIRREVATAVRQVCINVINAPVLPLSKEGDRQMAVPAPTALFLNLLLAAMPNEADQGTMRRDYAQYFDLLCALTHDYLSLQDQGTMVTYGDDDVAAVDVNSLVDHMVERIQQHRVVEKSPKDSADTLLMGAMKVLVTLLTWAPARASDVGARLMDYVFLDGLFSKPGAADSAHGELPVCKTDRSRAMAYTLLGVLCEESPDNIARVFTDCLMELSKRINPVKGWGYSPSMGERSATGLVGLKNLGNTCYLNSTLQQLYMKPAIREAVLTLDTSAVSREESIIAQLQHLFGNLSLSEKMDATTERLCKNIKDWDGNSINVMQQQDAQSFLLSFLDKLEDELANCGDRHLISKALTGTMINQLIHGEEMREREENFTCISVEVKNSRNIDEALEKFVSPDTITGFNWDEDHKNVDIQKRNVLGRLPSTLIVHLNRFTMNLDTFMTEKLNSRFEFPLAIDMEPYTKEGVKRRAAAAAAAAAAGSSSASDASAGGATEDADAATTAADQQQEQDRPPSEDAAGAGAATGTSTEDETATADAGEHHPELYELCGVVVHMGTADRGHYISFVKDRERKAADGSPLWYEFNDSVVRLWDVGNLEQDCFGGPVQVKEVDEFGWQRYVKTDNIQNAYLLIYDKVQPAAGGSESEAQALEERKAIPPTILQEVTDENNRFAFERNVFHKSFFNFVLRVVSSAATLAEQKRLDTDLVAQMCNFTVDLAFQVLARADENHSLSGLLKELIKMYSAFPDLALQLLQRETFISDLIRVATLECPDKVVRGEFSSFLTKIVEITANNGERAQYGETIEKDDKVVPRSPVETLFVTALNILRETGPKHWTKLHQLLCFIRDLGTLSPAESTLALKKGWIASLCDFALQKHSPFFTEGDKRVEMGNKSYNPNFSALVECVVGLVKFSGLTSQTAHELLEKDDADCLLSHDDVLCLDTLKLYELAFDDALTVAAGSDLLVLWCRGSEKLAKDVSTMMARGIDMCAYLVIEQWLQPLRKWFALDDGFHGLRVWSTLGEDPLSSTDSGLFSRMWTQRYKFERWFFFVLQAVMEIAQHDSEVIAYLAQLQVSVILSTSPEKAGAKDDELDEDMEVKTEQKYFFDLLFHHYATYYTSRAMPSWLDRSAAEELLSKFRAFERQHRSGAVAPVVVDAVDSGLQELFKEAKSGVIVRIRQDRVPDEGAAATADELARDTENNVLSLHIKNMRDEPVTVQVSLALAESAEANFELPEAKLEVLLRPTMEAEVWQARKKQAGASWTKGSFAADVKVEWDFKITLLPDYSPTPLSDLNLRQQEGHKDVRTFYQDPQVVGGPEVMGVYQAMIVSEETSSIHAVDDEDYSDPEP